MSLKDLEEFLNEGKTTENSFDWNKEKKEWLKAVDTFYSNITVWLRPLTDKPNSSLKISFETMVISEEELGDYEIKKLNIVIKGHRVVLEPIGTNIIGAKGRIDMVGTYGTVRFLLVDKNLRKPNIAVRISNPTNAHVLEDQKQYNPVEFEWKIVTLPPNIQYIPLNEETFSNSLLSVIKNG